MKQEVLVIYDIASCISTTHTSWRLRRLLAIVILGANLLGALHLIPVFPQLLLNSSAVVYLGCIAGTQIAKTDKGYTPLQSGSGDE